MSGIGLYVDPNTLHVGIGTDDPGSASLFVGGDINFTGDLKQGGLPFIGSRWERSNLDISYTPGNVGIGTSDTEDARLKVEGNIAFTGRLIQNGIDYQGSKWSQTGSNIDFIQGNVGIGTSSNADARLTVAGDIKLSGHILNEDNEAIWIPGSSVKWRAADTPSIIIPNGISWTPTASSNTAIYRYIGTDFTYNFNVIGSAIGLPTTPGADIKLTLPFPIDYTLSAYSTQPIVVGTVLVSVTPSGSGSATTVYTGYARTSVNSADAMTLVLRYVTGNTDRPLSDMTTAGSPVAVRIQGQVTYTTPIAANNVEIPVTYTPGTFEQDTAGKIIYNGQGAPPQAQFQVVAQSNVPAFTPAMIVDQKSPDDGALITDFRGDGISVASFDTEGNLRLSGQLRNSSNETVWLPGTAVMWKQAVPPAFEGPGGPTIAYSSSNATFRYVGNEIIYNFRLSGNIVAQPPADVDYKLQLQYPILEASYPMDTIVGDLWLNVSSNQAGGPTATTFKAYAKTIQGSVNNQVLATRYLNGALDLGLATIAIGSDITLQGTLVYQASNVAANFRVPLAEYRSIIQDQEDNIIINGGGAATRARFEVVETREDVPLMIGHYNPPADAEIKADTDIFRITRTPIGAGASSNEVFNIRQNGDVRISGNILDANSNATWIPGSTLQWRTGDPPNLSAPTGLSLTYASSNALYRYIGDEFVYNFNVEVGVSGTASDAFADYTLQLSQPVKTALYNTNSEGSIIGSLVVNAYAGGASNTYTGYAKTDPTDPARVILRYINGTYDHPLTDILAGNTIKLQGQITYTTPLIANNVTVPLDYVEAMFVQDQVGNVVLNGDGAAPQAAFDIRQTTSSTVPTIIANQPTSSTGDFMQLRKNNVNVLTISNTGNIMTPGSITASNLRVLGDYVVLDTITSNTEQMVITNDGTGPALKVTQTGANSIAEFYDDGNVLAFKIANNGLVGIGTNNPQNTLQVTGTLSVYNSNTLAIDPFKETIFSVPTTVYGHKGDISDDGNTVVVSGQVSGSTNVYIYKKVGSSWVQTILMPSNASYPFGQDVKISSDGNTIVLPCFFTKGYFNVLKYNGSSWAETIVTSSYSDASQNFGTPAAVSSDGNTIVAGRLVIPDNNTFYVFKFNGTSWVETVVTASVSSNIVFQALAISGDGTVIVIVSQFGNTFNNATPYVFKWNGTSWVEMMTLAPSSTTNLRYFAYSVSISGNGQLIACGNIIDNSAFLFRWNAGTSTWVEEAKITPTGASVANPYFGTSIDVSLDGNAVAVSADWDGKDGLLKVGAVYIFKWNGTAWLQTQKVTPATAVADLYFGRSVAIASEGSSIVVGSDAQSSAYIFGPESTGMASMERLKIDTSGNVGIGTTNPQSILHVAGTTRIDGNALIGDSATTDAHTVQGSTSMTYSGTAAALTVNQQGTGKLFELQDAGTPQFIVLDGGNVGIGTSPQSSIKLDVIGNASITGNTMIGSLPTTNQHTIQGYASQTYTGTQTALTVNQNGTGKIFELQDSAQPVMTVLDGGNVGIGTANPVNKLDVNGNMVVTGNMSAANMGMFRNRIINGDMRIDQRYNGAGTLRTNLTVGGYYIDRFYVSMSFTGGVMKAGQNTITAGTPPYAYGFRNSYRYEVQTVASAVAFMNFGQLIEGLNVSDLMWGTSVGATCTCSFWYRSSALGYHCVAFRNDQSGGVNSYVAPFNITSANIWQYITVTVPPPPSGSLWNSNTSAGITIMFAETYNRTPTNTSVNTWITSGNASYNLAATWNNVIGGYVEITGVQFEKGTIATPFEFRLFAVELQLCQRYLETTFPINVAIGYGKGDVAAHWSYLGIWTTGIYYSATFNMLISKRTTSYGVDFYNPYAGSGQISASGNGNLFATPTNIRKTMLTFTIEWASLALSNNMGGSMVHTSWVVQDEL